MASTKTPRQVRRRKTRQFKLQTLLNKFKPSRLKAYWFSKAGRKMALKIIGGGFLVIVAVFLFYAKDLPSPSKLNAIVGAQTTKFYDRTGQTVLYEVYGDKNRSVIDFNQMPDNIKQATVAVEDKNFYKHGAFSVFSILRAAFVDLFHRGSGIQGGSTITQQYVKNALLAPDRSIGRKVKELILSIEIEQFYKKDDILKLYLNEIPYGTGAYGIEAASKTYFKHPASQLSLDEAAMLAAIPRAPTYYSPYGQHTDDLIARKNLILDLMVEQKYVTQAQADAAKQIDVLAKIPKTRNLYGNVIAPHFVLYVQEQLEAKYGTKVVTEGGLKVITTLDLAKQKAAEDAIAKNMKNVRALGGSNAALVSGDPKTGQILSMVGSYDFSDPDFGAFNVAISNRQPGSSFKPFVYATAWGKQTAPTYGPGSTLYDVPTDFGGGYRPTNYSNHDYGVLSMRQSIGNSLNVPSVKVLYLAGVKESIATAHAMGITTLNDDPGNYGLSLVLGSGDVKLVDMVNSYEAFAAGGQHNPSTPILKITDSKGATLEEFKPPTPKKVIDPQVAYLMSNVLSDPSARTITFGNFAPFNVPGHTTAIKTGTTEFFRDAWTMGYTPSLVAGVWTGNNNNKPMSNVAGAIAAPIWHDFMVAALAGTPNEDFVRPPGIQTVTLDTNTGRLPGPSPKATRTDLFPSWYKAPAFTDSKSATIDKVSGLLATDCTPPLAKQTAYSSEIHAEIPSSDPAYGRWEPPVAALAASLGYANGGSLPTASDNVHNCNDTKPSVTLTVNDIGSGVVDIKAQWSSGTFTVNKLDILMDDQIISTQQPGGSGTYEFDYQAPNGSHTFKAIVTDTGLYQAEDDKPLNITDSGPIDFHGTSPTGTHHGLNVNYQWTSYPASGVTYQLFVDGAAVGGSTSSTSEIVNGTGIGSHTWHVQAISGGSVVSTTADITYTNAP